MNSLVPSPTQLSTVCITVQREPGNKAIGELHLVGEIALNKVMIFIEHCCALNRKQFVSYSLLYLVIQTPFDFNILEEVTF